MLVNSNKSKVRLILRYQGEGRYLLDNLYRWNKEVVIFCGNKKEAENLLKIIKESYYTPFCENGKLIGYSIKDDSLLGGIDEILKSDMPQEEKNNKLIELGVNRRERKLLLR
ncbi:MAG: hypothetical protein IJ640_00585 [Prevotella sp.]|nr:hypothetical protein [Prevotella sp.]